jgi:hypothetical protein
LLQQYAAEVVGTLLQHREMGPLFLRVATVILDIIVAFLIPLIALPTSKPVMWYSEHLRNFVVLQRVHFFSLVYNEN